jgi:hypothetical protein
MTNWKSHLPDNYFLTEEEKQDLRDWALESFAKLEQTTGKPVRLVRNRGTNKTATDSWQERKRERDLEARKK